jgi:hypothetical protein
MLRTILNAAILPLECLSLGITAAERTGTATCWILAATVATAAPAALRWARQIFSDTDEVVPPIHTSPLQRAAVRRSPTPRGAV